MGARTPPAEAARTDRRTDGDSQGAACRLLLPRASREPRSPDGSLSSVRTESRSPARLGLGKLLEN